MNRQHGMALAVGEEVTKQCEDRKLEWSGEAYSSDEGYVQYFEANEFYGRALRITSGRAYQAGLEVINASDKTGEGCIMEVMLESCDDLELMVKIVLDGICTKA